MYVLLSLAHRTLYSQYQTIIPDLSHTTLYHGQSVRSASSNIPIVPLEMI